MCDSARTEQATLKSVRSVGITRLDAGRIHIMTELTATDIYHFREGTFFRAYDKLGAHPQVVAGVAGTRFAVRAPNARAVHVIGDFNCWKRDTPPMRLRGDDSAIWGLFIPAVTKCAVYT